MQFAGLMVLSVLMRAAAAEATPSEPTREWDFSKSHHIDQVPWPKRDRPEVDPFHHVTVNGIVSVKLAVGKMFSRHVEMITFARRDDYLTWVGLDLENQTAGDAFATAKQLARQWSLPLEPLERWKKSVDAGGTETALAARRGMHSTAEVEILNSFDKLKPFRIVFRIGWNAADAQWDEDPE